ncbi:hypothetical protein [Pseudonocardia asaccharolytica]|nr:hypothetical protein [Pseudonocardia asaccharolytica]
MVSRLAVLDDLDLYQSIVIASFFLSSDATAPDFPDRVPDEFATVLDERLRAGWFALPLRSPQAWYSTAPNFGPVSLTPALRTMPDKPMGARWTSSYQANGQSAWEYGEQFEFFGRGRHLHSVFFRETEIRCYEIDSLKDYRRLCLRYPDSRRDNVRVYWERVAEDYDAVRLTTRGLVHTHGVRVETPRGVFQMDGWDSESTAWLRKPPGTRVEPARSR